MLKRLFVAGPIIALLLVGAGCQGTIKESTKTAKEKALAQSDNASPTSTAAKTDKKPVSAVATKKPTGVAALPAIFAEKNITPSTKIISKIDTSPIAGVPKGVSAFLNKGELETFKAKGFKVNTGSNPPKLDGSFDMQNLRFTYDSTYEMAMDLWEMTEPHKLAYYAFEFKPLSSNDTTQVTWASFLDRASGLTAYVSGEGSCFTIFVKQTGSLGDCTFVSPQLMSGCVSPEGITNFKMSYYLKSKSGGDSCENDVVPVGTFRIAEQSNLAPRREQSLSDELKEFDDALKILEQAANTNPEDTQPPADAPADANWTAPEPDPVADEPVEEPEVVEEVVE